MQEILIEALNAYTYLINEGEEIRRRTRKITRRITRLDHLRVVFFRKSETMKQEDNAGLGADGKGED